MGLLSKLKNVFFEEEEVEVEEKPKKEKPIAKKVELPKKEKKEKIKEEVREEEIPVKEEKEEVEVGETYTPKEKKNDFKFPVLLEDDLIEEEIKVEEKPLRRTPIVEEKKQEEVKPKKRVTREDRDHPYDNSYTRDLNSADYTLHDRKMETKTFKLSPIISPVYGVLDKNYKKEEIQDKKETHTTSFSFSSDKLDLDTVRKKAFGDDIATDIEKDIEEDIDDSYDYDNENEENTTLDMTDTNMTPVVDKVTVGDAEEYFSDLGLEYNVDYKDHSKEKSSGKKATRTKTDEEYKEKEDSKKEDDVKEVEEDTVKEEKEEKKTRNKKNEENEDIEIEDNLFDLIDSMYDEGE